MKPIRLQSNAVNELQLKDFKKVFGRIGSRLNSNSVRILRYLAKTSGPKIALEEARKMSPVPEASGSYLRAFGSRNIPKGAEVYNETPYAGYIERGRRPGARTPPPDAILRWMEHKGIPGGMKRAWTIAIKIGIRGIKARPVMRHTAVRLRKESEFRLNRMYRKTLAKG
jgi:hypothetical protein